MLFWGVIVVTSQPNLVFNAVLTVVLSPSSRGDIKKSSTGLPGWGDNRGNNISHFYSALRSLRRGEFHCTVRQVTMCDSIWQVTLPCVALTDDYAYDEDASFEDSQRVPYDHRYDNESPWRYGSNDDNYYYDDDTEEGRPKRVEDDEEAEEEYSEYENEAEREALRELLAERAAEEARLALLAYLTSGEPKYRSDEPQYLVDPSAEELALEEEDYNALMSEPDDLYDEEPPPEEENLLDAPEKRNSFYPYSYEPYGGRWGALVPGTKRGDRDPYDRLYRLAEVLSRPAQLDYDEK